jgi:glycerophosphoryl diester phosphodiesterase
MVRPYLSHEHPIRFAHRGSRVLWPENTMAAFQGAVDLGYRYLEIDVHASRDRRLVVFHDDALDRLTDGSGKVWEWTWADLRRLDAAYRFDAAGGYPRRGTGVGIPLLEEALSAFGDRMFNIDLKQPGIEELLAEEIRRLGAEDRVLIGSFSDRRIHRFRRLTGGRVATSAGPREVAGALAAARLGRPAGGEGDAFQVPQRVGPLTVAGGRLVTAAHAAGKHVHVWTVDDPGQMHRLLDLGVDGIVTDRPDVLNRVVAEREEKP